MRIEVKAKIILTVPEPKAEEPSEEIVLAVERHLNGLPLFETMEQQTKVGIRVHTGTMEVHH